MAIVKAVNDFVGILRKMFFKDEKWAILTLPECKDELEPYYKQLKDFLKKAKE